MPYNFATESFHTKKLCSRLSSRKVKFSVRETKQVAQLSQRNRAAGWVSFGPNITGTRYCAANVVGLGQEAQVTAENARI